MELWMILDLILALSITTVAFTFLPYAALLVSYRNYHQKKQSEKEDPQLISVIIPVHNGAEIIRKKIDNTMEADYPKCKMEIIVVDDGSTDKTAEKISKSENLKIIRKPKNMGKAYAIEKGVSQSEGEIIVITDADVLLPKNAIRKLVANFSDENVGFACGKLVIGGYKKDLNARAEDTYRDAWDILQRIESHFDSCIIINGALCAIRKKLYEPLGFQAVGDDTLIGMNVRRKGFKVVYDNEAIIFHSHSESLLKTYHQKKRRAFGIIQAMMRNRDMLFSKNYGKYGRIFLPLKVSAFMICPFALLLLSSALVMLLIFYYSSFLVLSLAIFLLFTMFITLTKRQTLKKLVFLCFYVFFLQIAMIHANFIYLLHRKIEWH